MALRASADTGGKPGSGGSSPVAGLPASWDLAECPPKTEWEYWLVLFVMTVTAKSSTSVAELIRTPTEQQPRQAALINNLNEQAAERKTFSVLFLSEGSPGRNKVN